MRLRCVIVALGLAACGRIGFNPVTGTSGGGDDAAGDGTRDGNGGGSSMQMDVLPVTACTNAIAITQNVRAATGTCVGGDHVDSCGPPATQEVAFKFSPAVTAGYNFRAFDPGTMNVSNSTQQLNDMCQPMGNCAGILGITVNAGTTAYFVVEAAAGGCANIEFEAQ